MSFCLPAISVRYGCSGKKGLGEAASIDGRKLNSPKPSMAFSMSVSASPSYSGGVSRASTSLFLRHSKGASLSSQPWGPIQNKNIKNFGSGIGHSKTQ